MWSKLKSALGFGEDPEIQAAKTQMEIDHTDPRKRFVSGVLAMSQDVDPAYLAQFATTAVSEWYGIESREELIERIEDYLEGVDAPAGYDAFRAAFLARAAVATRFLNPDESWEWAFKAARKVQRSYPNWNAYGMGYLEGHLAYRKSEGDGEDEVRQYRQNIVERMGAHSKGIWARTPFDTPV